jgi:hypothetical protein
LHESASIIKCSVFRNYELLLKTKETVLVRQPL